jgi:hypothetical protein
VPFVLLVLFVLARALPPEGGLVLSAPKETE